MSESDVTKDSKAKHYTTVWANDLGWHVSCDAEMCTTEIFPRTDIGHKLAIMIANAHETHNGIIPRRAEDA